MRIYITKHKNGTFVFKKETTMQSIISDAMTILVLLVLIGIDLLCCIYVQHLVIVDILILVVICTLLSFNRKNEITKEEFLKELNK